MGCRMGVAQPSLALLALAGLPQAAELTSTCCRELRSGLGTHFCSKPVPVRRPQVSPLPLVSHCHSASSVTLLSDH